MNRKVWKRIFWISLVLLILLILFTIGIWALANAAGALFAVLFMLNEDVHISRGIPFGEFMSNFVGSPLFYIYLADLAVLVSSIAGLFISRRTNQ